jgi:hypothetical protein
VWLHGWLECTASAAINPIRRSLQCRNGARCRCGLSSGCKSRSEQCFEPARSQARRGQRYRSPSKLLQQFPVLQCILSFTRQWDAGKGSALPIGSRMKLAGSAPRRDRLVKLMVGHWREYRKTAGPSRLFGHERCCRCRLQSPWSVDRQRFLVRCKGRDRGQVACDIAQAGGLHSYRAQE